MYTDYTSSKQNNFDKNQQTEQAITSKIGRRMKTLQPGSDTNLINPKSTDFSNNYQRLPDIN